MRTAISKWPAGWLRLTATLIIIASCKPEEEAKGPTPNPPGTDRPPVAARVATNAPAAATAPVVLAPAEAKKHIGETATVRGKVFDVHVTPKGDVFINFGGKYPQAVFTAVCFQGAIPASQLTALNGKTISVSGQIRDYNGQVEIVLESADQIGK